MGAENGNLHCEDDTENVVNETLILASWIDNTKHEWKESMVQEPVQPSDVDVVRNVKIPLIDSNNVFRWPHTRDGRATVKSVYHSLCCS